MPEVEPQHLPRKLYKHIANPLCNLENLLQEREDYQLIETFVCRIGEKGNMIFKFEISPKVTGIQSFNMFMKYYFLWFLSILCFYNSSPCMVSKRFEKI